jgi:hypothetical protein
VLHLHVSECQEYDEDEPKCFSSKISLLLDFDDWDELLLPELS